MIIGKYFAGDNDESLKMYQHERYHDFQVQWGLMAREELLKYEGASSQWDSLIRLWKENVSGGFDHRCIQAHHDLIAASFRKHLAEDSAESPDKQMAWHGFFKHEARAWLTHKETLCLFVTALACRGTTAGYDAEDSLFMMMREHYGL